MSLQGYATLNGTAATFRRVALGAYSVTAGTQATTNTDTSVRVILQSFQGEEEDKVDVDERVYRLPASEITGGDPETEDQLIIGTSTYEITNVRRVEKRGVVEFYTLNVKRLA